MQKNEWLWLCIPITLGVSAFLLVVGPHILNPNNIDWLVVGDPAIHYLSWVFYRFSPWSFPIGLNPNFGLEISSSIVFTDPIPIFAFIFKLFTSVLPDPFQYFGLWVLLCFVLQGVFGYLLISTLTSSKWLCIAGAGLFIFSPPMLARVQMQTALQSHFVILAALYLIFSSKNKFAKLLWITLLGAALLINIYLFMMVFALWLGNLSDQVWITHLKSKWEAIKELMICFLVVVFISWQAGYFALPISSASTGEYGADVLNLYLLAIFDPRGWSYFLKGSPYNYYPANGFSYLGLGIICLIPLICAMLLKKKAVIKKISTLFRAHLFLCSALLALSLFAITNSIHIGSHIYSFYLPQEFIQVASSLRASGRMFWPVFYCLILLIIYLIIRLYPKKVALGLLSAALVIQVCDTSAGYLRRKPVFTAGNMNPLSQFSNAFWGEAGRKYKKIIHIPTYNRSDGWEPFAHYALSQRLPTNSVFAGRSKNLDAENKRLESKLITGNLDKDTLYFISNDLAIPALLHLNTHTDLLMRLDGFNILAPGWLACSDCQTIPQKDYIQSLVPTIGLNEAIGFGRDAKGTSPYFLQSGWAFPENWGVWSTDLNAGLILPIVPKANNLILNLRALVSPKNPAQKIEIWINGQLARSLALQQGDNNQVDLPIPKEWLDLGYLAITFVFKNPARPQDIGLGDDERLLAIGLVSATQR